jgi:hypothetical protein
VHEHGLSPAGWTPHSTKRSRTHAGRPKTAAAGKLSRSHSVRQPDIDGLIRLRLLRRPQRHDILALQGAVRGLLYRVLDGDP